MDFVAPHNIAALPPLKIGGGGGVLSPPCLPASSGPDGTSNADSMWVKIKKVGRKGYRRPTPRVPEETLRAYPKPFCSGEEREGVQQGRGGITRSASSRIFLHSRAFSAFIRVSPHFPHFPRFPAFSRVIAAYFPGLRRPHNTLRPLGTVWRDPVAPTPTGPSPWATRRTRSPSPPRSGAPTSPTPTARLDPGPSHHGSFVQSIRSHCLSTHLPPYPPFFGAKPIVQLVWLGVDRKPSSYKAHGIFLKVNKSTVRK